MERGYNANPKDIAAENHAQNDPVHSVDCSCDYCELERQEQRREIKFHFESDGESNNRTFYVIAQHEDWSDCKRLDFDEGTPSARRKQSIAVAGALNKGQMTMHEAAVEAKGRWL